MLELSTFPVPCCGIDEAGRGPWAGPVVAAAVILDPANTPIGLNDSKKLSAIRRETLFGQILATSRVGIGEASVDEIDALNILQATYLAMRRAIEALPIPPGHALIDGNRIPPDMPCTAEAIIKGDAKIPAIAAASIIAKVTRDRIMSRLDAEFPGYGWAQNAGYGVAAHAKALIELGVTPYHRRSFKPVHKMLCEEN